MKPIVLLAGLFAALAALSFQVSADDPGRKPAPAQQQAQQQKLSPKVSKALMAARDLLQKQDWEGAYARVREAQGVANKTPFDDFQIAEMLGYVEVKREHYSEAVAAFEQSVSLGFLQPSETTDRLTLLAQLQMQLKNYPKAIEYANKALQSSSNPQPNLDALIGQAQYLTGNYRDSAQANARAVERARKLGKPVQESWLQIELSAYGQLNDEAGVLAVLQQLALAFPQKGYLEEMFGRWKLQKDDDRALLHVYRLMMQLNKLQDSEDFLRMSQLALDLGLPGEAANVIEQGKARKVFTDEVSEERARRQLEAAKAKFTADLKLVEDLQSSPVKSGEDNVQLGIARASYQEYAKAADFLQAGIAQGGLRHPDEAQLVLGETLVKVNQPDEARAAFAAVDDSAKLATVARLWQTYVTPPASQAPNLKTP